MFDNKNKIFIIGAIIILIGLGGAIYFILQNNDEEYLDLDGINNEIEDIKNETIEETEKIVVYITGQVVNPGVITLNEGVRIIDAINKAGGVTEKADLGKINLAYVLSDAQKIYIPSIDDVDESVYISKESGDDDIVVSGSGNNNISKGENVMVNINTANVEELQKLPGIGEGTAQKIIAYRKEQGKFTNIEDIQNVSGIGTSKFDKIKNNICVK